MQENGATPVLAMGPTRMESNFALTMGGGIHTRSASPLMTVSAVLASNQAPNGGGVYQEAASELVRWG